MRRNTLVLGILASFAACGVSSANTFALGPDTVSPQTGSFSSTLSFPQFNSSLGTLTGVEISATANFSVNYTVTNPTNASGNYSNAFGEGAVEVTGPAGLDIFLQGSTPSQAGTVAANSSVTFSSQTASDTEFASAFDFADYTGDGSSLVQLDFAVDGFGAQGTGPANFQYSANGASGGAVTITYTYTPNSAPTTPEPATWAMMGGAGLIALGLKRKRSISHPAN